MQLPTLKIAGVEIALQTFPVSQTYRRVDGGSVLHRALNGAGLPQHHWTKLATSIAGEGWAPVALAGVDWSAPVEILCVQPRAIHSASTVATLPAARRSDLTVNVYALAVVDNELIATPVVVVGDTATATAVAGASGYQFMYFPKLSCWSRGPVEPLDLTRASYGWTLEAEEV